MASGADQRMRGDHFPAGNGLAIVRPTNQIVPAATGLLLSRPPQPPPGGCRTEQSGQAWRPACAPNRAAPSDALQEPRTPAPQQGLVKLPRAEQRLICLTGMDTGPGAAQIHRTPLLLRIAVVYRIGTDPRSRLRRARIL